MIALLIKCRPIVKKAAAPFKHHRRPHHVHRAGRHVHRHTHRAAAVSKTKVIGWACVVTPIALVPPLFVVPSAVPPAIERPGQFGAGHLQILTGVGTFVVPETAAEQRLTELLPPLAFAPVPDCCAPGPNYPQPQPETSPPPEQPQPVAEPPSLAMLATAVGALVLIRGRG